MIKLSTEKNISHFKSVQDMDFLWQTKLHIRTVGSKRIPT